MKRYCPLCLYHWAWKLNDGRFKCRRCGHRYTFRSVWEVCRLSERTKRNLLHDFVQGGKFSATGPSRYARDRFVQLSRMTLALHEHYGESFTGSMVSTLPEIWGESTTYGIDLMVLGIRQQSEHIRVFPVFGPDAQRLVNLLQKTDRPEGLYYTADLHAYGTVAVREDMVVALAIPASEPDQDNMIEQFWQEVNRWLSHYHKIPVEWFHLFIGEVSFRFHHRDQKLLPVILDRIKKTPSHELKKQVAVNGKDIVYDTRSRRR